MDPASRIKIAQVITRLDWGGSPDIFRILSSHLDPGIFDITLVVGDTRRPTERTKEFLGRFRGSTATIPALKRDIDPVEDLKALWALYKLFRRERFDIVHTHTAKAGALGRLAAWLAGGSVIIHTPHGHNFYGYFGGKASRAIVVIESLLTHITDRIIALTALEKADNIKAGVATAGKVSVIYQGLELDTFVRDWKETARVKKTLDIDENDAVVGMAGRLESVKGSDYFIEAAAQVAKKYPNTKFVIVGEGSVRRRMEQRAGELGIGAQVIFTGWREDVPALLSIMDILVLPSLNEAVGMVLIEAQAEGVPVVATRVGGVPEVVRDGRTGILVPPSDAAQIADAVISLLSDKERRLGMGESAKEWVRNKFRAEDMANKTSTLYIELLHKRRCVVARKY